MAGKTLKITVIGAAGGIGQPLSLLLRSLPQESIDLRLYDVAPVVVGVAVDLSHIPTPNTIKGFTGDQLPLALQDADIVVVPAGVPRKPGMTRDDLFNINAKINADLAAAASKACPNAHYLVISNPVNSIVPVWAEVLKKAGTYNPRKLIGVTTLDQLRAESFVKHLHTGGVPPVIGGHAGKTIVPLYSKVGFSIANEEEFKALYHRVAFGGDEVVEAKQGAGSATLSMAQAAFQTVNQLIKVLAGSTASVSNVVGYVENAAATAKFGTTFFATTFDFTPEGVANIADLTEGISAYEQELVQGMVPELKDQIEKGVQFGTNYSLPA